MAHAHHHSQDHQHDDHDHGHGHGHVHGHAHCPARYDRAFAIGIGLNVIFVILEAVFGVLSGSLALVADAGHNLSDVLGLVLAWGAAWLSRQRPTTRHTYGYRRSSILAALGNAAFLLVACSAIAWEVIRRFLEPEPVDGMTVVVVAAIGIAINTGTALMFMRGRADDINIHGAFLHMAADAAVSAGVVIAALLIMATGWLWIDPLISLVIAGVILIGTWGLLRDSLNMAMDAVPRRIDRAKVEAYLAGLCGIVAVHDLHVWHISTTEVALTAHLVRPGTGPDDALLAQAAHELQHRFKISHATFQVEHGGEVHPCRLAPDHVV
jgi:cobalt-zinc-cadmium efflux system protein